MNITIILFSVAMICTGQILFKLVGQKLASGLMPQSPQVIGLMATALMIYGIATVLWVFVLKSVPLTKAYPYMALSFIIVPALSVLVLSEKITPQYMAGSVLIVVGLILTARA